MVLSLSCSKVLLLAAVALVSTAAAALDFASVAKTGTILYAGPSTQSEKRLVASRFTPFEVVIDQGDWLKVRDQEGSLAWVEKKQLSSKRTAVVVTDRAQIRSRPDVAAPVLYEVTRAVALEVLEAPAAGWVKVKHPEEKKPGFIRIADVWGL